MAHIKTFQFYRNNNIIRPDTQNNKDAITVAKEYFDTYGSKNDGEITLMRYQEGNSDPIKTIAGIYSGNSSNGHWTYLIEMDAKDYYTKSEIDSNEEVVAAALNELNERIIDKPTIRIFNTVNEMGQFEDGSTGDIAYVSETEKFYMYEAEENEAWYQIQNQRADWNETRTSSWSYIQNKPTIPQNTSDLTNDSNFVADANYIHTDNNYTTAEKNKLASLTSIQVVNVQSTGDVVQTLNPDTFYIFGSINSLTISIVAASSGLPIYAGKFTASANWGGVGLNLPSTITEATNNDTVEAGKTYEYSILDGIISVKEVA